MDPAFAKEISMLANARAINDAIGRGDSDIQQFYKNTTVLITGGTGFMGKQLLEKLFRSCDIKKVFMLMRPKKRKSFNERLAHILEDPVFDSVKKMRPGFDKKICAIEGDVAQENLGISAVDRELIIKETEIIIHGAATVNFDEPLKVAVNTNVRGTVETLELGKQCKKLKSYVHISTAYAHATYSRIEKEVADRFYDAPLSPQLAIEMANTMEEQRLNDITSKLIQNWPNTYTFTKAIAEEAVRQAQFDLPICLVRPAIVAASYQEPAPGWLDMSCATGPSGLLLGSGMGVLHVLQGAPDIKIDLVPVDRVNNAIIVAGWAAAKFHEKETIEGKKSDAKIYTVTSMRNPLQWSKMMNIFFQHVLPRYPTPKMLYYIFITNTKSQLLYFLLSWLWHYIPAYCIDFVLYITGQKTMAVKLYTKAEKHSKVLSYFTTHEWLSKDKNMVEMFESLNETDKQIYNCDIASVNWQDMIITWSLGCRKYIVKDGLQGSDHGIRKQFWLKILHYAVIVPIYFFSLYKIAMLGLSLTYFVVSTILSVFY